jgi:hypothetical protein
MKADASVTSAAGRPIWQAASDMIDRHGQYAPLYAQQSFGLLMERGDFKGAAQWRLVCCAIEELLQYPSPLGSC